MNINSEYQCPLCGKKIEKDALEFEPREYGSIVQWAICPHCKETINNGELDTLPEVTEEMENGSWCTLCWSGSSGWYQDIYELVDGKWKFHSSTAPWQLSVG